MPFVEHSYAYHFTRIDHRHNFSVYNTVLHLNGAYGSDSSFKIESLAFLPQILLSLVIIPYFMAPRDLASAMLAQTFAFVTFNKVCTSQVCGIVPLFHLSHCLLVSQYFLWYMVFLPFYLPSSSLMRRPVLGVSALVLWIVGQAAWLQQGYELEFLGSSAFVPGLWLASVAFFGINCWLLGLMVQDVVSRTQVKGAHSGVDQPRKAKQR